MRAAPFTSFLTIDDTTNMSDTELYAETYKAIIREYPRIGADNAATLAAQICKAGIPYRAADGTVAFRGAELGTLAPRLAPKPDPVGANESAAAKVRKALQWAARGEDKPRSRRPMRAALPDYNPDRPIAEQVAEHDDGSERGRAIVARILMQKAEQEKK